jgi:hypothetical protein
MIENSDTFKALLLYMADTVRHFLLLFQRPWVVTLSVYGNANRQEEPNDIDRI